MAVATESIRLKAFPGGLAMKELPGRFLQTRAVKIEARRVVADSLEVQQAFEELKTLIERHEIGKVREIAEKINKITADGLQTSYVLLFKEYWALKEKIEADIDFLKKHGSQMSPEQKKRYGEFLKSNLGVISETRAFVNELRAEIKSGKQQGKLNERASDYHTKKIWTRAGGFLKFLNKMFEERGFGNEAKLEFKLEHKISSIEEGKINSAKIDALLKKDKVYSARLKRIIERTFVYILFLVRNAYDAGDLIMLSSSSKRWELPPSYEEFAIGLTNLLNDEIEILDSLDTCRLQLEHKINTALGELH